MRWDEGIVRPVSLEALGHSYRRYRLADPPAEEAMAGSLRRWGQLAPVVACWRGQQLELLDGFKRWTAARQVAGLTTLSVRVLQVDERTAKAAILGLNRGQRGARELEEAWIVQALVREDGLTQVEAAHLLGQHKSWVCRRLALLEKLSVAVKEDLRLGLVGAVVGAAVDAVAHGQPGSVVGVDAAGDVDGSGSERRDRSAWKGPSEEQAAFVLARPREALRASTRTAHGACVIRV